MLASLRLEAGPRCVTVDAFQPDLLANGLETEGRVTLSGVSWERYLEIDKALGDNRPGPRFCYLDGELEIISTSADHERIKKRVGGCLGDYIFHLGAESYPRGQATMRLALERAGAEPDESWCLHDDKEFPDLVLEVVLNGGGIHKLGLYQRFGVPEVWFWRRGKLEVHTLNADGSGYEQTPSSRLLPGLDLGLMERCVTIPSSLESRRTFRGGLASAFSATP